MSKAQQPTQRPAEKPPEPPAEPKKDESTALSQPAPTQIIDPSKAVVYATSLDLQTEVGRAKAIAAYQIGDLTSEQVVGGDAIEVSDYFCYRNIGQTDEGEEYDYMRMVLFLPDGRTLPFASKNVIKGIIAADRFMRKAPWNPPLRVVIREISRGNKRHFKFAIAT